MGKMILDDLRKRLNVWTKTPDLMIDNNDRYQMVIVGRQCILFCWAKLTRATHDIDAFSECSEKNCYSLLGKCDINTDVGLSTISRIIPRPAPAAALWWNKGTVLHTQSGGFGDCKALLVPGY